MRKKFYIKIDPVAVLRNSRKESGLDPVTFSILLQNTSVDGICCCVKEDESIFTTRDIKLLKELMNLPMVLIIPLNYNLLKFVTEIGPQKVIFSEDHGDRSVTPLSININKINSNLDTILDKAAETGINAGLLLDPDLLSLKAAFKKKIKNICFNVTRLNSIQLESEFKEEFAKFEECVKMAKKLNFEISIQGEINFNNIKLYSKINEIDNIITGHCIITRAIYAGIFKACEEFNRIME